MPTFSGIRTTPPTPRVRRRPRWPEAFEKREAAQDAIDLATFRRIHDETMSEAYLAARDAPDEESARKGFDRASSQVSTIESTKPGVQQAYARFYEGAQASWQDRFARQAAGIERKNLFDRSEQNIEARIQAGDLEGAAKELAIQAAAFPERQAKNEWRISQLPQTSALLKIREAMATGNLQGAREAIEEAWQLPLTVEQKEDLAKREAVVGRLAEDAIEQEAIDVLIAADEARHLPPAERVDALEQLRPRAMALAGSPAEARRISNWFVSAEAGEPFEPDPRAAYSANQIVSRLNEDSSAEEIQEAKSQVLGLASALGMEEAYKFLTEIDERLDELATNAINSATDIAVAKGLIDESYVPVMRRNLEKWHHKQKKEVTPTDIMERGAAAAVLAPKPEPELPMGVTEANLLRARTNARMGGPRTVTAAEDRAESVEDEEGVPYREGDTVPWGSSAQYERSMRDNAGERWYEDAELHEDVLDKFPLSSFLLQSPTEQAETFEEISNIPSPTSWVKDLLTLRYTPYALWRYATEEAPTLPGDFEVADVEVAREIRRGEKEITPGMVAEFGEHLRGTSSLMATWTPGEVPAGESVEEPEIAPEIPAVGERIVGEAYTIRGKRYEWQLGGWKLIP